MTRSRTSAAGFTIIELMITIAVLSILLSVGVPAFTDLIRNTRLANQTNALVGSLNYARNETTVRGLPISICAARTADREDCVAAAATATNWQNGWIVFTDRIGTPGAIDPGDEVLTTGEPPVRDFAITTTASFVRFGVGATPSTERTFTVAPTSASACLSAGRRQVAVGLTGRVATSKSGCT